MIQASYESGKMCQIAPVRASNGWYQRKVINSFKYLQKTMYSTQLLEILRDFAHTGMHYTSIAHTEIESR